MPSFLETLGFVVYLAVMYGGMPDRELLATAYASGPAEGVRPYRGVLALSPVEGPHDMEDQGEIDEAAA
jgi:hypothetical protein